MRERESMNQPGWRWREEKASWEGIIGIARRGRRSGGRRNGNRSRRRRLNEATNPLFEVLNQCCPFHPSLLTDQQDLSIYFLLPSFHIALISFSVFVFFPLFSFNYSYKNIWKRRGELRLEDCRVDGEKKLGNEMRKGRKSIDDSLFWLSSFLGIVLQRSYYLFIYFISFQTAPPRLRLRSISISVIFSEEWLL